MSIPEEAWQAFEDYRTPRLVLLARIREQLVIEQHGLCAYCGCHMPRPTLDHVICRKKGGTDDLSNLVAACEPCNAAKGDLDLDEFLVLRRMGLR